nr:hypothetical protein [Tanacetum cinerariifolium]
TSVSNECLVEKESEVDVPACKSIAIKKEDQGLHFMSCACIQNIRVQIKEPIKRHEDCEVQACLFFSFLAQLYLVELR